jgi:hypothetical protein
MGVVAVIDHSQTEMEAAERETHTPDGYAPYGVAGYIVGECTVVCAGCVGEEEREDGHPIFGNEEVDYPGACCEDCQRPLDTNLLVYDSGPGSEILDQIPDHYKFD